MMKEVEILRAAGEETRIRILRVMIEAGKELCACELIDALNKPQYTISKSLGILVSAGLVSERREGRQMMYTLITSAFNTPVFDAIGGICCSSSEDIREDVARLKKRLALREKGKCSSGCQ